MTEIVPLLAFTVLSGLAAGAYLAGACFFNAEAGGKRPWSMPLVSLILLGLGLLATLMHLGHPERFMNAMANPGAMVAQEAYWSMGLGIVILVDLIVCLAKKKPLRFIRILGAVLAIGLMVVTALAYYRAYGNPAWFNWTALALFIVGDMALGFALYGMFDGKAIVSGLLAKANVAIEALYAVSIAAVAVHFSSIGAAGLPWFIAAMVIGPVAVIGFSFLNRVKPGFARVAPAHILACAAIGTILARYAFYSVNFF